MPSPRPRPKLVLVGKRVHRSTCMHVRDVAVIGGLFTGMNSRDVALAVVADGLQPCRGCKPIKGLAWWEHQQIKAKRLDTEGTPE